MYKPHMNAKSVALRNNTGETSVRSINGSISLSRLSSSASLKARTLTVSLTNTSAQDAMNLRVRVGGQVHVLEGKGTVLTHGDPAATNTFACPATLVATAFPVKISGGAATVSLPRQSVAALQLQLS